MVPISHALKANLSCPLKEELANFSIASTSHKGGAASWQQQPVQAVEQLGLLFSNHQDKNLFLTSL